MSVMTKNHINMFEKFLQTTDIDIKNKNILINTFKQAFLSNNNSSDEKNDKPNTNTNSKHKKIERLSNYRNAKTKQDIASMKGKDLKHILESNKKNKNGSKSDLVDRVWWLLHQDTPKPKNMELKKRGRPPIISNTGSAFVSDSEEDDDNVEELMAQYNITKTWNKICISNNKISTSGREYYRYKDTKCAFQKTLDGRYIPGGTINLNGKFDKFKINVTPLTDEFKQIINTL